MNLRLSNPWLIPLLALCALSVVSCAKTRTQVGTDGVTHWLAACDTSFECGELECLCGVCTSACEDDGSCAQLGAIAQCLAPSDSSCTEAERTCVAPADIVDSGQPNPTMARDAAPIDLQPVDASVVGRDPQVVEVDAGELDAAVYEPVTVVSEVTSEYATPNDEIVLLWYTGGGTDQYFPERPTVEGDLERFRVEVPSEPPVEGRYFVYPDGVGPGVAVARAAIYRVGGGLLDTNWSGVNALDLDKVVGQTDAHLFWTAVDLPAGWQPETPAVTAGWHLFLGTQEIPLESLITMDSRLWT